MKFLMCGKCHTGLQFEHGPKALPERSARETIRRDRWSSFRLQRARSCCHAFRLHLRRLARKKRPQHGRNHRKRKWGYERQVCLWHEFHYDRMHRCQALPGHGYIRQATRKSFYGMNRMKRSSPGERKAFPVRCCRYGSYYTHPEPPPELPDAGSCWVSTKHFHGKSRRLLRWEHESPVFRGPVRRDGGRLRNLWEFLETDPEYDKTRK